jgi:hypothetical protein
VWLIIPLIYFLGWWQTGSLRQAFNGTIAWIAAFSIIALALLAMDVGGFSGMTATPDSPAAAIAILGGFIGMWISNYLWRRRGGDPPRNPGKWERAARAMLGMDKKKKKKKKAKPAMQGPPPYQQMPPPPPAQQPVAAAPMDAQYRPAPAGPPPSQQQPAASPANTGQPQSGQPAMQPNYQAQPAPQQPAGFQQSPQHPSPGPQQVPVQPVPTPTAKKSKDRTSPTANKYAKATGRALGAMFRGSDKKKKKPSSQ